MKLLASLVFLVLMACSNDAITYAHLYQPYAQCYEVRTRISGVDSAVCVYLNVIEYCESDGNGKKPPSCTGVYTISSEPEK